MTRCEQIQNKIDDYMTKAIKETDQNLKLFYFNAGRGLENIRDNMTIEELRKSVD